MEHIASLFNDEPLTPDAIQILGGGVSASDVAGLYPKRCLHQREGRFLKRKIAEFKSFYGNFMCCFEAIGNGDAEYFVHYSGGKSNIQYAHCF